MKRREFLQLGLSMGAGFALGVPAFPTMVLGAGALRDSFSSPPHSSRAGIFWWWLNGYVSREGILRDLEEMKKQGISSAIVFNAGRAETPEMTEFLSTEWRDFFRYAVEEAAKREITISLNLCDGWNAGGPWIGIEDAPKTLLHTSVRVQGPGQQSHTLPRPNSRRTRNQTHHDIAVFAWRLNGAGGKSAACEHQSFVDLTDQTSSDGQLTWDVPEGEWLVVRFGWQVHNRAYTDCAGGQSHPEVDPLRAEAMEKHFAATAAVVMKDVAPHVGKTFKYVHIDSGEIGNPDWTQRFPEQFQRLRGYDPLPWLAAKAGFVVDSPEMTERFLEDYEQTIADLMIECYYGRLNELAHEHGLGTHSEGAGFQKPTVDALRSLGSNDLSMAEFWARSDTPRGSGTETYIHQLTAAQLRGHDAIKTAASAANIYGRKIVQGEAFTLLWRPNFDRGLFDLKDIGDRAFCAGLQRNVLHHYICQADEQAKPGYVWPGTGMEFTRHVTWWPMVHGWLGYLARCQHLLQQGRFPADVCYLQDERAPAYVPAVWAMDPPLPAGYQCDVINTDALKARATAEAGRLALPGGPSYRYLVLWQGGRWQRPAQRTFRPRPDGSEATSSTTGSGEPLALTPASMRKLKALVESGVTLVGPPPSRAPGLNHYPECDAEVKRLADDLWGQNPAEVGARTVGKGRVIWGRSLAEIMADDGVRPDLEIVESPQTKALPEKTLSGIPHPGTFDWIHRQSDGMDLYFIANLRNADAEGTFTFHIGDRRPEIWDPVTGQAWDATDWQRQNGRTVLPLRMAPRQSLFVVFRNAGSPPARPSPNLPALEAGLSLEGPWTVKFDPAWGGPDTIEFEHLQDWTKRPEEGIRHYSGTATYRKSFDVTDADLAAVRVYLDLGEVKEVAEVRLNGKSLGVVWTAPWRVDITDSLKAKGNVLEVDIANVWHNRLVLDAKLPPEKRLTTTNARIGEQLFPSGLLGPVRILRERA